MNPAAPVTSTVRPCQVMIRCAGLGGDGVTLFAYYILDRLFQRDRWLPPCGGGETAVIPALKQYVVGARGGSLHGGPNACRGEQQVEDEPPFDGAPRAQVEDRLSHVSLEDAEVRACDISHVGQVTECIDGAAVKHAVASGTVELEQLACPVSERRPSIPSGTNGIEGSTHGGACSRRREGESDSFRPCLAGPVHGDRSCRLRLLN